MTPDKTLEELAEATARDIANNFPHWQVSGAGSLAKAYGTVLRALQSATAAQQREVENIQKAGDALADIVESLSEQLRTEREGVKELESWLRQLGQHRAHCAAGISYGTPCDCGLDKLLSPSALSHSGKEGV